MENVENTMPSGKSCHLAHSGKREDCQKWMHIY